MKGMEDEEFKLYANNIRGHLEQDEVYSTLERYAKEAPKNLGRIFQNYRRMIVHRKMNETTYNAIAKAIEELDYLTEGYEKPIENMPIREKPAPIYQTI